MCDHPTHTTWAIEIFDWRELRKSINLIPYPLWHITVNLVNKILYIPPSYADAIVTALFHVLEFNIIYKIMVSLNKELLLKSDNIQKALKKIIIFSASIMFVQPIYIQWFNSVRWVGQGTLNAWTNPGQVTVYSFALIVTFLFLRIVFAKCETKFSLIDFVRLGIYLFLSVISKPSFIQVFLPAVAILLMIMLIRTRGKSFLLSLKIALSSMPALIWCCFIFIHSFITPDTIGTSGGNSIAIGFLEAWSIHTPNVFVSILIGGMFPLICLLISLISDKKLKNMPILFIILCYVFGILEFMFFKEEGSRIGHANFQWGYGVSILLMFVFIGSYYISLVINEKEQGTAKNKLAVLTVILTLNVLFGIEYYVEMWRHNILY